MVTRNPKQTRRRKRPTRRGFRFSDNWFANKTLKTLLTFSNRQANGRYAQLPAPDPSEYPTVDSPVLCVACEAGKYKSNQGGFTQDACISCPANMDSADASVSQDQCRCEEGYSGPDGSGPCKAINSAMEQACTIRGALFCPRACVGAV
jgi:hypothetical protein